MRALVNIAIVALNIAIAIAPSRASGCGLPPAHWCDTPATAARCDVTPQCAARVTPAGAVAAPVRLTLYYESLCPGCRAFIAQQLYPVWDALRASAGVLNLTIVPYGNAHEAYNTTTGQWQFTCQHGPEECQGNVIEACAMYETRYNQSRYFPFIHCMERTQGDPIQQAPACAKQYGIDYANVTACAKGSMGSQLIHANALKTEALKPKHTYVPWVTLNGVHTEQIQSEAMSNLLGLVCKTYTGQAPPPCRQVDGTQILQQLTCKGQ